MYHPYFRFSIGGFIPPPPPIVQQNSGGWLDLYTGRKKTRAELKKEREDFGIIPKKAKAIIERVALQIAEPDDTEALIEAFDRATVAYRYQYAEYYRQEVARLLREEAEEFLMLH